MLQETEMIFFSLKDWHPWHHSCICSKCHGLSRWLRRKCPKHCWVMHCPPPHNSWLTVGSVHLHRWFSDWAGRQAERVAFLSQHLKPSGNFWGSHVQGPVSCVWHQHTRLTLNMAEWGMRSHYPAVTLAHAWHIATNRPHTHHGGVLSVQCVSFLLNAGCSLTRPEENSGFLIFFSFFPFFSQLMSWQITINHTQQVWTKE